MQVDEELAQFSPEKDMLLTIGVFDGVHTGHKYLISKLVEQARQRDLFSGVVTFRRHPLWVLSPRTGLPCLTGLDEKVRLIKNEGVDEVIPLSFNQELAHLSAQKFVSLLKKHLKMRGLVVGPDFALGKNREGDVETLTKLGQKMDFSVTVVPPLKVKRQIVSSTALRQALANGEMEKVTTMLGRFYSLEGRVISGTGRGTGLGFPTANLEVEPEQALPAGGVYATLTHINGKVHQSVTNIGTRPTFDGNHRTIETYILKFKGDIYGSEMKIEFVARLRDEQKFDSVEKLQKQISGDIKQAINILESRGKK